MKSIQFCFFVYRLLLLDIFKVGTGAEKGVPRPVVNKINCAPAAASAVEETRSLPGAESRDRPALFFLSAYANMS